MTGCSSSPAFVNSNGAEYENYEKPSVENARIGVMIGSTNEEYVKMHYPHAKVERFNNYVESAAALLDNTIDYAMMDYTSALGITRHNPELEIVSDFLTDEMLSLGTNKNNPELAEQVFGIVSRYLEDGTMDEIISHWILEDGSDYEEINTPKHEDAPVLRVAIISSREPTTFVLNNKYAGLDIELIDRIAYELGYRVEYLDMDLADVLEAMGSERMDMSLGMYATPEREEHILFSPPYFANPQVIISQK